MRTERTPDQLNDHLERVSNCKSRFKVCHRLHDNRIEYKLVPITCNSHFCPSCRHKITASIIKRCRKFCQKRTIRFLTLTYSSKAHTPNEIANRITSDFNRFITMLRKKYKYKFEYIRIAELTKNKAIHFHILIDSFIPIQIIKREWFRITRTSYIVHIAKPQSKQEVLNYVLKYISKSQSKEHAEFMYLHAIRRISFSRNALTKIEKKEIQGWIVLSGYISKDDLLNYKSETKLNIANSLNAIYFQAWNYLIVDVSFETLTNNFNECLNFFKTKIAA